jgi:hypothetical protein
MLDQTDSTPRNVRARLVTAARIAGSATAAIALLAVAGYASSSHAQDDPSTMKESPSTKTLVFISRDLKSTWIDRPPKGKDNPGDEFVGTHLILDRSKRNVGRDQIVCLTASHSGSQCSGTFYVPGGTLEALGDPGSGTGPQFTIPVVGGTGAYAGDRGTVTVTHRKGVETLTFSLVSG